jgi:hypothetical protein
MIHSLKELMEFTVQAEDGPIGEVLDFYIDDNDWRVRYLVSEPENDLSQLPAVLLSTASLEQPDPESRLIPVQLQRDRLKSSPEIQLDQPLTRQQEIELHDYYGWPFYWGPATVSGMGPGNLLAAYPLIEMKEEAEEDPSASLEDNPHLRSTSRLLGFDIQARNGGIGHVEDILIEGEKWNMLYVVIDTGNWLPGRTVLLSPSWVADVDWEGAEVHFDLDRETIRNSPEYDPAVPVDAAYETRLNEHYGRRQ